MKLGKKAIEKKRKILVCCVTELLLLLGSIVTAPARIVKLLSLYVCMSVFCKRKALKKQFGENTMMPTPF